MPEMTETDGKYPAKISKKQAVTHSVEKSNLLNLVNFCTKFYPKSKT